MPKVSIDVRQVFRDYGHPEQVEKGVSFVLPRESAILYIQENHGVTIKTINQWLWVMVNDRHVTVIGPDKPDKSKMPLGSPRFRALRYTSTRQAAVA